ncbi:MAG: PaaI family thioesterase [Paracoccaceae bacterium]
MAHEDAGPSAPDPTGEPGPDRIAEIGRRFVGAIPWSKALGMELLALHRGVAEMRTPYDARFVGDAATGVLHGGVLTALLDSCSGAAVMSHPSGPLGTATIDLRIDYMRAARPGKAVTARAECHRATRSVAFVRAVAYEDDPEDPVATSTGAFTIERGPGA